MGEYKQDNEVLNGSKVTNACRLVGNTPAMQEICQAIKQVANTDANVLVLGESGTGKEVVARNIHYHSSRKDQAFVPVNCGAIPADLLESELFGHEKGAFTGAITARKGRFCMAEGGTLFLDEIGEMTMAMQVKLLRVLEERVYEKVGGTKTITADVRIVAATNRNLEEMVAQGKFREDLYFRLDVFPINLPALRERREDIPLLIKELIARMENRQRGSVRFTPDAVMAMAQYDWPGNVRELGNQIERMAIQYPQGLVQAVNLPPKIRNHISQNSCAISIDTGSSMPELQAVDEDSQVSPTIPVHLPVDGLDLKSFISNIEVNLIQKALDESGGVIAHAAKNLGLQRTTLAEKMRKYGMNKSTQMATPA